MSLSGDAMIRAVQLGAGAGERPEALAAQRQKRWLDQILDIGMSDERAPRAPWLITASCFLLLVAVGVLALEFWSMGRGRGHPVAFFGSVMAVLAAGFGAGLTTLSMVLPQDSVASIAIGGLGILSVVAAACLTVVNGIAVLGGL